MLLGVLVKRRLQVKRIDLHHFRRRSRLKLRRHEDHGRYPTVNRERETLDQFLVGDDLVFARWQSSINSLQEKGMDEFQGFPVRAHDHRMASAAAADRSASPCRPPGLRFPIEWRSASSREIAITIADRPIHISRHSWKQRSSLSGSKVG